MRTLANLARIRRMEFFIVELTILLLPILVTIRSLDELATWFFAEAFLLFFTLYTLGDVVNCLADRDLDATYKTRLSRAVYELGVPVVRGVVIASLLVSVVLAAHLALTSGKWALAALVAVGIFLGLGYSVRPLFFKGRGLLHLACLWLLLYFVPMLYAGLLVSDVLGLEVALLAAAYATVEMGIILVNTSEDYPEDRAEGVVTTTVALGLPRTIRLAAWMVVLGGLAFYGLFGLLFVRHGVPWGLFAVLAAAVIMYATIAAQLWRLHATVRAASLEDAIAAVKARGRLVPVWATVVGWSGVLCGLVLVHVR